MIIYLFPLLGIDLMDLMGQGNTVLSSDGDAARKAKGFYKMIRTLQNGFTEIEKVPKALVCLFGLKPYVVMAIFRYCSVRSQ